MSAYSTHTYLSYCLVFIYFYSTGMVCIYSLRPLKSNKQQSTFQFAVGDVFLLMGWMCLIVRFALGKQKGVFLSTPEPPERGPSVPILRGVGWAGGKQKEEKYPLLERYKRNSRVCRVFRCIGVGTGTRSSHTQQENVQANVQA